MNETDMNTGETATKTTESETQTTEVVKKTAVPRADQDQLQANFVGEVAREVQVLQQSPESLAKMAKRNYDAAKLNAGLVLVAVFQAKRAARQEKLGGLRAAGGTVIESFSTAKGAVTEYRESVRLAYPDDKAMQQILGVNERVPQDQEKFLVYATTCATTAKKAPYATALEEVGFELSVYESTIAAFDTARTHLTVAEQEAKDATAARDTAFNTLKKWAQSFRRALRLALK